MYYEKSVMESAIEMVFGPITEALGDSKRFMESGEYKAEITRVRNKLKSLGPIINENSSFKSIKYNIKMEEVVDALKGLGYTPAKYGVSSSYGYSLDSITMYKQSKQGNWKFAISVRRDNDVLSFKDDKTIIQFTCSDSNHDTI